AGRVVRWSLLTWEENEPSLLPGTGTQGAEGSAEGQLEVSPAGSTGENAPSPSEGMAEGWTENPENSEGLGQLQEAQENGFENGGAAENEGYLEGVQEAPPENESSIPAENPENAGSLENGGVVENEGGTQEDQNQGTGIQENLEPQIEDETPSDQGTVEGQGNVAPFSPENEGPQEGMGENAGGQGQVPAEGAGTPALSRVDLQVRVSSDGESWSDWMGPDGTPNTLFTSPPVDLSFLPPFRYLQVRVFLRSEDPGLSGEEGPKVRGIRAEPRHGRKAVVGRMGAGEKRRADFGGQGFLLRAVSLRAARDLEGVEVYVSPGKPEEVPPLEGKKVLAYVEIFPSVAREDLEEAEIEFAVPKGWLRGSNPSGSRAVLFHYGEPGWEELPTVEVGEEGEEILFLARTPGFSTFAFVDNTNEEFSLGTHENTENVGDVVRLVYGYTQGRFTSRVFDAGGVAQWDNLVWSFAEPEGGATNIAYVGAEPDTLKDGSSRVGTQWQGTYENTRNPDDGSYENLSEASTGGASQETGYAYVSEEYVYTGTTENFENAQNAETPPGYEKLAETLVEYVFYSENEDTQMTDSTDPIDVLVYEFSVTTPGDYLLAVTCELSVYDPDWDAWVGATLLVDGFTVGEASVEFRVSGHWRTVGWVRKFNFSVGLHTVQLQYFVRNRPDANENAYIRDIHVLALKLPSGAQYTQVEIESTIATSVWDNVAILSFTPPTTENYLILASIETRQSSTAANYQVSLSVDGTQRNLFAERPKDGNDYWPRMVADVLELQGGVEHSIYWERYRGGGTLYTRRARICAIPLGKIQAYFMVDDTGVSTNQTTYQDALVFSPSLPAEDNYILFANSRMRTSAVTYLNYNNFVIDGTQVGEAAEAMARTDFYYPAIFLKRLAQAAGTHTYKIQHMVNNTATTITTTNRRIACIQPKTMYLDVEHVICAPIGKDNYILQIRAYLTGEAGDAENVEVYLWNFDTGTWDYIFTISGSSPQLYEFNLTGTSYILGTGKVRVRYAQPEEDRKQTVLMLDYTRVYWIKYLPAGQSLNWQHTITGVTPGYDNYDLKIRGYSYGDLEYIWVDVWNVASGQWESTGYYLPRNSPSTITFRLSPLENYLDGDSVHIRFRDDSPSDATPTYLILDMVRIEEAFWATSDVKLQVRVSGDNLNWTDWMGPDGTSSTYFEATVTTMENIPDNRYIQYRIYFSSQHAILTGENGPKVDWVRFNVST
ncbi:MAG: PGF-pre-PGF domain-containing protein, partial [Candidatus Hadarchaeales archaeon]